MPYIFVDDGSPEAGDYAENYVWYEAADPQSLARAHEEARRRLVAARTRSLRRRGLAEVQTPARLSGPGAPSAG